jgi:outer membrane protein OmpA-like peptidoglycan-associated protein
LRASIGRGWKILFLSLLCTASPVNSAAQEPSVNAQGWAWTGSSGALTDSSFAWRPTWSEAGDWSGSVTLETAARLLPIWTETSPGGDDAVRTFGIERLAGLHLSGRYALTRRGALVVSTPVWWAQNTEGAGSALGDVSVASPWMLSPSGTPRIRITAVPWISLPTGSGNRWLGDSSASAGGVVAVGGEVDRWFWTANAGAERRGWGSIGNVQPGLAGRAALSVGATLRDAWSVQGEFRALSPTVTSQGLPAALEASVLLRGRRGDRTFWHAGLSRGLSAGVGAAEWRLVVGAGFGSPMRSSREVEPVRVVEQPPARIEVVDPDGRPVSGATVSSLEGAALFTDEAGAVEWKKIHRKNPLRVGARGMVPQDISALLPGETRKVVLAWQPVEVAAVVRDETGQPLAASIRVLDASGQPLPEVGDGFAGLQKLALTPGDWLVEVSSPGRTTQLRSVSVQPGRTAPVEFEALLSPAEGDATVSVSFADAEGGVVEGARVVLDGRVVGSVASGGDLTIRGLENKEYRAEVAAEGFRPADGVVQAVADVAAPVVRLGLERAPGSVRVTARNGQGVIVDATVRFDGPSRLAAQPLGDWGQRVFVLRPGAWQVVVASAQYGLQQREVVIREDSYDVIDVDVVLQPYESGSVTLDVRVVDVDGLPVADADVGIDGRWLGRTSTGGTLRLAELLPGPRSLAVRSENLRELPPIEVDLVEGTQEQVVVVGWNPGTVALTARTPVGLVSDAIARFSGPESRDPRSLGSDGSELVGLSAGRWALTVTSPLHGWAERSIVVPPDSRSRIVETVVLQGPSEGRAVLPLELVGPDGQPVVGAEVSVDGVFLGQTSADGSFRADRLDTGVHRLEIEHPLFSMYSADMELRESGAPRRIALRWGEGLVRVMARSAGGPVGDALIRAAGPAPMRPLPVDARGERLFLLPPGIWQLLISSPQQGIQEHQIAIEPGVAEIVNVSVDFLPLVADTAELVVRVQNPDGGPVEGAAVLRDGQPVGVTGVGGMLVLSGLSLDASVVEVSAPSFRSARPARIQLQEGAQERIFTLEYVPRPVRVQVRDAAGRSVDAEVRFEGPETVAPQRTGSDGDIVFELRPGKWQILASGKDLEMQRQEWFVAPGLDPVSLEFELSPTRIAVTQRSVTIREQVPFDFNEATLRLEASPVLAEVAATLIGHPEILRVEVQGHTDDVGGAAYNLDLSQRRADAVRDALIAGGVPPERLVARGYGATRPRGPNADERTRAMNRRVQFEIVESAPPP